MKKAVICIGMQSPLALFNDIFLQSVYYCHMISSFKYSRLFSMFQLNDKKTKEKATL